MIEAMRLRAPAVRFVAAVAHCAGRARWLVNPRPAEGAVLRALAAGCTVAYFLGNAVRSAGVQLPGVAHRRQPESAGRPAHSRAVAVPRDAAATCIGEPALAGVPEIPEDALRPGAGPLHTESNAFRCEDLSTPVAGTDDIVVSRAGGIAADIEERTDGVHVGSLNYLATTVPPSAEFLASGESDRDCASAPGRGLALSLARSQRLPTSRFWICPSQRSPRSCNSHLTTAFRSDPRLRRTAPVNRPARRNSRTSLRSCRASADRLQQCPASLVLLPLPHRYSDSVSCHR